MTDDDRSDDVDDNDEEFDDDNFDEDDDHRPVDADDAREEADDDDGDDRAADDVAATARDVVEYLARAVVENPDEVRVKVDDSGRGPVQLDVFVDRDDMGRVIGKRGRVANSIRSVVRAAATRDDVEVDVEFVD